MTTTRNMKTITAIALTALLFMYSCDKERAKKNKFIENRTITASGQTLHMLGGLGEPTGGNYPVTVGSDSTLVTSGGRAWTSGFFPGSLWRMYELTEGKEWSNVAGKWTRTLEPLISTGCQNFGLMVYCGFGNAHRIDPKPEYENIILESAARLAAGYNDTAKMIICMDWPGTCEYGMVYGHQAATDLMDLELLFYASRVSGSKRFYDVAMSHANSVMEQRCDTAAYIRQYGGNAPFDKPHGYTCSGHVSAAGQARKIYGLTMVYRETKDQRYLDAASKTADTYLSRLPEDHIPYIYLIMDGKPGTPEQPHISDDGNNSRDVTAAAVSCSALFELGRLSGNNRYTEAAIQMFRSLASPAYSARRDTNGGFLLKRPINNTIYNIRAGMPMVCADYYYLEALQRYKDME